MTKLKFCWEFYKSIFLINLFLIIISLVYDPDIILINLCFFAIPIIYFYKEYFRENEYYFYHNMNLSKLNLYTFCLVLNFIISILILVVYEI